MCGFVGFLNEEANDAENNKVIRGMADKIAHRGPDMDDYYVDGEVSLGFRRLSIIDLEGGSQPITNEDGTKVLVFNGEIYNFQQLRGELIEKGHIFKTRTDSEVLLHGYEEYGPDITKRLRQRVEDAVRRAGYLRHQAAVLLRRRRDAAVRLRNQGVYGESAL